MTSTLSKVRAELWQQSAFSFLPHRNLPRIAPAATQANKPRIVFCGVPSDYSLAWLVELIDREFQLCAIVTSTRSESIKGVAGNALESIAFSLSTPLIAVEDIN